MAKENENVISNREVKDSAFTTYFGEPENASKLYAALADEEVDPGCSHHPGGKGLHRRGNSGGVHEESWIGGGEYVVYAMGL